MAKDGQGGKNPGQRKRRQERESCINNVKLSLSSSKDYTSNHHHQQQQQRSRHHHQNARHLVDNTTYTKRPPLRNSFGEKNKFQRCSLENISSDPWGDYHLDYYHHYDDVFEEDLQSTSTLRRTRSLALTRDDIFSDNLNIQSKNSGSSGGSNSGISNNNNPSRRAQLIPRAKLIERNGGNRGEHRYPLRGSSVENLHGGIDRSIIIRKKSSLTPPNYSPTLENSTSTATATSGNKNRLCRQAALNLDPASDQQAAINSLEGPKFIIGNLSESSDSNQHYSYNNHNSNSNNSNINNRSSIRKIRSTSSHALLLSEGGRKLSYEDLAGLSLPNYYPDSKSYDTSNTDLSVTDNISTGSYDRSKKYSSCDNLSAGKWTINESESISYDDNIVLSANRPLYDSLRESNNSGHYGGKPRTIRGPTPYKREKQTFYYHQPQSHQQQEDKRRGRSNLLTSSSSDTSDDKQIVIDGDKISLDYFETDSNFDEIRLNNENIIRKTAESSQDQSNHEDNQKRAETSSAGDSSKDDTSEKTEITTNEDKPTENLKEKREVNRTRIEVDGPLNTDGNSVGDNQDFKTVVAVETESVVETSAPTKEESPDPESTSKHSHKYLREFLETQKGSRKPLQNFLTKKFSNLSRKNSKDLTDSNLVDNQFHSLPDITVSKNLRKFEKIDKKLRKCEKVTNIDKKSKEKESRFIVNIGKHFDITANSNIPVDFEVKIAKIPKKNKPKRKKSKSEENFLQAVKHLKDTLNGNKVDAAKTDVVGITKKQQETDKDREEPEATMELHGECVKEYKEKLGTMRTYWCKMVSGNDAKTCELATTESNSNEPSTCKIVDVQTKVDEVKKKFEPTGEDKVSEKPSIVQTNKQLFEPKLEKAEKISSFIKETCRNFEHPDEHGEQQFESLNPNIVEIINKDDAKEKCSTAKHKTVTKSTSSNITYPEFDHVRYRVVKSDLFQKKIFANCDKESQFDGLMQYLQDYSFQELLTDNNIVIIEPIRTKVPHESPSKVNRSPKNITPLLHKSANTLDTSNDSGGLRRHFFYHPIRVNKEVNDDELPNPDTVKQVRELFEGGLTRSQSSQEFQAETAKVNSSSNNTSPSRSVDPDKDHCSATDTNSNPSNVSDFGSQENLYDSLTPATALNTCCEQQLVSEDIMEKIRECGTTVTYYGGRMVKKQCPQPSLTKVIMDEIRNNEQRSVECRCKKDQEEPEHDNKDSTYQGVRFRLIKSNSCNSRLELVGTTDLKESAQKYINKQKQQKTLKQVCETNAENNERIIENDKEFDKNIVNETIKKSLENNNNQPKIISEERKLTQWGDTTKEKTYANINYNARKSSQPKITYEFHNFESVKAKSKKIDDMEFEPYEVAS